MTSLRVVIESGSKRTFACAVDWPGLARSGRTEEAAIEALVSALPHYAAVAAEAGEPFAAEGVAINVVERLPGDTTTDFGAPGMVALADGTPLSSDAGARQARLLVATWTVFDRAVAAAPESLRPGPRGGGRSRSKIVQHVEDAESAYASVIGIPPPDRSPSPVRREAIAALLALASDGAPVAGKRWPARYAARRIAWHVLDHAWEIEDRATP